MTCCVAGNGCSLSASHPEPHLPHNYALGIFGRMPYLFAWQVRHHILACSFGANSPVGCSADMSATTQNHTCQACSRTPIQSPYPAIGLRTGSEQRLVSEPLGLLRLVQPIQLRLHPTAFCR